jgi:PQQ-like domain
VSPSGEAPEAVIDLGLERDVPDLQRARPGRGRFGLPSPTVRKRWAIAGCLALVLLAVAGAAPPRPSLFLADHQPQGIPVHYQFVEDRLFVMTGGEESTLSSYHLPDGRLLWSVPAAGDVWAGGSGSAGGVVLVLTDSPGRDCCQITAYDLRDGRVRWSGQAVPVAFDVDAGLLAIAIGFSKQVVDLTSGRILWQGEALTVALSGPRDILVMHDDGTTERRDVRSGDVKATGRTHAPGDRVPQFAIVDGHLIVADGGDPQKSAISSYDVDTLALTWRRTSEPLDGAAPCGPVLCLVDGLGVQAVDPRTGVLRWRADGWFGWQRAGRLVAITQETPLVTRGVGVIDPRTGRILLDLRMWTVSFPSGRESQLVLTRTSAVVGRTTVAVLDLARLAIEVVGVLPSYVSNCQSGIAAVACQTEKGNLQLWAYRR